MGLFLRIDTIGPWGDNNNLGNPYTYVGNNPWSYNDPYGEWGIQIFDNGPNIGFGEPSLIFGADAKEGAFGGATIVADTFTFGQIGSLNAKASSYQGAEYTASRILAVGSRELLIAAGTGGLGNAAVKGGRGVQFAHKSVLALEAGSGGYAIGEGAVQISEGDVTGGALSIFGGTLRTGGAVLNGRTFTNALRATDDLSRTGAGATGTLAQQRLAQEAVADQAAVRTRVLSNIQESTVAREASNFSKHVRRVRAKASVRVGIAAEEDVSRAIGITRNAGPGRVTIPGTSKGGFRVPDFDPAQTIAARGTIVEVKNVKGTLSISDQLRDLARYADRQNVQLEIFTNAAAPKAGQLADLLEAGKVVLSPLP